MAIAVCNGTIFVLKITLHNSLSVTINFVSRKRDKKTTKKHHTFAFTAGARPTIPTILGVVIEEVRTIFCIPNFFGSDQ